MYVKNLFFFFASFIQNKDFLDISLCNPQLVSLKNPVSPEIHKMGFHSSSQKKHAVGGKKYEYFIHKQFQLNIKSSK
jgi:hypothetical protein